MLGLICGIKGCMSVNESRTKRIKVSIQFQSLKLEWGYEKWWCNMDGCVCAVMWNVERCAMWNEVECGL